MSKVSCKLNNINQLNKMQEIVDELENFEKVSLYYRPINSEYLKAKNELIKNLI